MDRAEFTPDALRLCGNASQVAYKAKKAGNAGAGHTGAGRRGRKGYAEGAEEYKNIQMRKQSQTASNPAQISKSIASSVYAGCRAFMGCKAHGGWLLGCLALVDCKSAGQDAVGVNEIKQTQSINRFLVFFCVLCVSFAPSASCSPVLQPYCARIARAGLYYRASTGANATPV